MKKLLVILGTCALMFATLAVRAQTSVQAESFVRHLYAEYNNPKRPHGPEFLGKDMMLAFSPALVALIRADARKTPKGDVGKLDGDPICNCQDPDGLNLGKLVITKSGDNTATAEVRLDYSGGKPDSLKLFLLWTPSGWRVDDIWTSDTPSLKKYLQAP